jgi:hypothetical protein
MRSTAIFLGLTVLGALSAGAVTTLQVSTFTPSPGETISLWASEVPLGAEFLWDLNGDGVADRITTSPRIQWTVPQGAHTIRLIVQYQGKVFASIEALIVADPYIACWQTIIASDGFLEVTVILRAKAKLSAPGLRLKIPEGWGTEVIEINNFIYKTKGEIQGFWSRELYPGDEVKFRYRLLPFRKGLSFIFSGEASAVVNGRYYTVPIAGIIGP